MSQLSGLGKAEVDSLQADVSRLQEELTDSKTLTDRLQVEITELKERYRDDNSYTY